MKIGELSSKTGVSIRSIRYYEEKKLIDPERLENGYRVYTEKDVERVKAVQLFLELGLNADEIFPVMSCESFHPIDHNSDCASTALSLYSEKLEKTRVQINHLQEAERELENVIDFWTNVENQGKGGDSKK
ncbi:MerR family transcriptional regulator [Virgibacillus sp. NKC19-3]|uniref:MerR family transcriptional regulator n=1 Tax=Virgibacillus saliphilus TaxID=2831674 RepID=UPI001C9B30EA|nr:MerR family transcriptional regulator [Virgibacillus sp. NKC19-3]MBY7142607.1 MerR family transcriptional regulator [Virgibacillus sp. NKC19-3]